MFPVPFVGSDGPPFTSKFLAHVIQCFVLATPPFSQFFLSHNPKLPPLPTTLRRVLFPVKLTSPFSSLLPNHCLPPPAGYLRDPIFPSPFSNLPPPSSLPFTSVGLAQLTESIFWYRTGVRLFFSRPPLRKVCTCWRLGGTQKVRQGGFPAPGFAFRLFFTRLLFDHPVQKFRCGLSLPAPRREPQDFPHPIKKNNPSRTSSGPPVLDAGSSFPLLQAMCRFSTLYLPIFFPFPHLDSVS